MAVAVDGPGGDDQAGDVESALGLDPGAGPDADDAAPVDGDVAGKGRLPEPSTMVPFRSRKDTLMIFYPASSAPRMP